jgi:tetratricopeptide (TPR) repeat protein
MLRVALHLRSRVSHSNTSSSRTLFGSSSRSESTRGRGSVVVAGVAITATVVSAVITHDVRDSYPLAKLSASAFVSTALCDSSAPGVWPLDDSRRYQEAEEFNQCLLYYRQQLPWYRKQWSSKSPNPISANWPRNTPSLEETSALEFDLKFCKRNPQSPENDTPCQNIQFQIASCYIRSQDPKLQYRGYKLAKELAERGHPDGMCLYGIILNEGRVTGVDANPEEAVVWWNRCIDSHMHIPSYYELAVALYTGEGVGENPELAVKYFERAANLHVGAAYMLGECLLDGLGIDRNRAAALEWLIVAAELGHRGAQARVLAILETKAHDDKVSSDGKDKGRREVAIERRFTVGGGNTIERRLTIGGGSGNPRIKKRRTSIVQESRDDGTSES